MFRASRDLSPSIIGGQGNPTLAIPEALAIAGRCRATGVPAFIEAANAIETLCALLDFEMAFRKATDDRLGEALGRKP